MIRDIKKNISVITSILIIILFSIPIVLCHFHFHNMMYPFTLKLLLHYNDIFTLFSKFPFSSQGHPDVSNPTWVSCFLSAEFYQNSFLLMKGLRTIPM